MVAHNFLDLDIAKKLGCKLGLCHSFTFQHALHNLTQPRPITQVLQTYNDIFTEPNSLSPSGSGFDLHIPHKEAIVPFNIRPYRYSTIPRDMVDKLVNEMLNQGIIQYSNSPFASPTVLVRKNDGSWRLCVDYGRLNQSTIKDYFPIPLIDDLMDELGGATIFPSLISSRDTIK